MKIVKGFNNAREALKRQEEQRASGLAEKEQLVRQIVADVRERGDAALLEYTEKFDGAKLTALEVDRALIDRALKEIDQELLAALELAVERITAYHAAQKKALWRDGANKKLGWVMRPLERVGVYTPGSQAPLPSSLLMTAVPAKVAGVREIVLVTPPDRQGRVAPVTLAAAALAGIDRVFSVGGAQAIAALAFGTATVPRVDKICGPGTIYTSLAKKIVYGEVGIDGLYGPSEVIVIADATASPAHCAADLLAQAEHGSGASAILIATSPETAEKVNREIESQLPALARRDVIAASLEKNGLIAVVDSIDSAIEMANRYAPEHLCLAVAGAARYIEKVINAGCLFIGENSIEALVDYTAGPSHVLPTGGTARFGSGLNILDFAKLISLVNLDKKDISQLGRATSLIARAEGLDAHARAVERRLEDKGKGGH